MSNRHPLSQSSYIFIICCIAALGGFLFGFDSGVINGTVDGLQAAFDSDSAGTGFNVASMLLGCAIGAFFAGRLADRFGRRTLLIVAAIFFLISTWGSGISGSSLEFVFYRVLGGMAVGAASVMTPAYISEVAPAAYRGRLATIQQVAIISGLFVAFLSNYVLAQVSGSAMTELWLGFATWRWMFWIELLPAAVFLIALLFIPESPRYLISSGRHHDARRVLGLVMPEHQVGNKLDEINATLAQDHKPRLSDVLNRATGKVHGIVWVGIGLALIDKIGRRPLLWTGSVGMAITLVCMAYAFSTATMVDGSLSLSDDMGTIALIAANAYVFFFNVSWGPVMWVMLGEMFPNQMRGSGLAIAGLFQWLANFGITMTFPIMLASIGLAGAYGLYAFCAVVSVFFVLRFVKETRGKELEAMAYE